MLAVVLATWLEMSGGPAFVNQQNTRGVTSGPMVRLDLGYPLGERFAAELWLSGEFVGAAAGVPGDRAVAALGAGGRLLIAHLDGDRFAIWAHGGGGWGVPAAGDGTPGPLGFAGPLVTFQPFIQRFSLGLEADALAYHKGMGAAVMPSLRCSF